MATASTTSSATCPIFSAGKDLNLRYLPTYEDVVQYYHYVRIEFKLLKKEPAFKDTAAVITKRLEYLWKLASIPTVLTAPITQMLKTHRDKMANIMKSINPKKINRYWNRLRISRSQEKLPYLIYLLVNALNLENAAALVNDKYQLWSSSFYSTKEAKGKWQ